MDLMIPSTWENVLKEETKKDYFKQLEQFLTNEYNTHVIYPPKSRIFSALEETPYEKVKVVLLGQDPYHGEGQANGLAFSVAREVAIPPSLRNMYKELANDLKLPVASHGDLTAWAKQGVLLLNTALTVRQGHAHSHQNQGWEIFTDTVIQRLNERTDPVIFLLWGNAAQQKKRQITGAQHIVLETSHPSPLSAYRGFLGSRIFSQVNDALLQLGKSPIDWQIKEEL